jgi:hypothetical protein
MPLQKPLGREYPLILPKLQFKLFILRFNHLTFFFSFIFLLQGPLKLPLSGFFGVLSLTNLLFEHRMLSPFILELGLGKLFSNSGFINLSFGFELSLFHVEFECRELLLLLSQFAAELI